MRAIAVDEAAGGAESLRRDVSAPKLAALARSQPFLSVEGLRAGYGAMEVVHDFSLHVARGQSLCLIGPNGAGKSTVLHAIFGFARIFGGRISVGGKDVTRLSAERKLREARIAYVLQDKSVFPNLTVEENLLMGGYLLPPAQARTAAERVFQRYERLADIRRACSRAASGVCSRSRAPSSWSLRCCSSTSLRSASSLVSSTRYSPSWPRCSMKTTRPS